MKKIENVTIYKCDFCKKELKRKHAMGNHEEKCNCNPINFRACLDNCKFLERKPVILGVGRDDYFTGEPITREYSGFFCTFKNQFIVHPQAEHRNQFIKSEVTYDKENNEIIQESMPKKCSAFCNKYS